MTSKPVPFGDISIVLFHVVTNSKIEDSSGTRSKNYQPKVL